MKHCCSTRWLVIPALWLFMSLPAQAASFNYLYVEASEGNSSGGHTAIQFDDQIYHFQHLDIGLIRLFRRDKKDFHFLYRYAQNRPIHESRIDVSDETFQLLQNHFSWQFLRQERLFKLLEDAHRERLFMRYLLNPATYEETASVLRLKGAGLFFSKQDQALHQQRINLTEQQRLSILKLHKKLEQKYGPDFLQRRGDKIIAETGAITLTRWPLINDVVTGERFPPSVYGFTDRYLDKMTAWYAIKAISEARPLQETAYIELNQPEFKLSEVEKQVLPELRKQLESRLLKSFNSERPDWGYAVFVNLARYLAVDATLQSGHWFFIDDFADNSEWIKPDDYLQHHNQLEILRNDARAMLEQSRQSVLTLRQFSENAYSRLEMAANRYAELLKSQNAAAFRYNGEQALPVMSIGLPKAPLLSRSTAQITAALESLDHYEARLIENLEHEYQYDLLSQNCVTELFSNINQALANPIHIGVNDPEQQALLIDESIKRLGGYIDTAYNFIPFVSYRSVLDRYHVTNQRVLDSYRGRELAKLKVRQNPLATAVRESNIVTSRLYRYNPEDALFVFFTDVPVPFRPVLGSVNMVAGIGQSLYGLFNWPFDAGDNLQSGATGILMSLPELLFFNIRKGSYKYLSPQLMTKVDI